MNLLIISGSTQVDGQSLKVAQAIKQHLDQQKVANNLLDLHKFKLPFFGQHVINENWQADWLKPQQYCKQADGVVLISPEYNGGPSPAILNLMLYVKNELAHKPVLLIGVSAGRGGAYPIAALRQNGPKDPGYLVLPTTVIISFVQNVLNKGDLTSHKGLTVADVEVRQQLVRSLTILQKYASALKTVDWSVE